MWLSFAQNFPKPILELGCGTGRVLLHLARNDISADGLDYSLQMLNRAKWKIALANSSFADNISLFHDDMTKFNVPKKYGLIFIACNSLNEVFNLQAQEQTVSQCSAALATNGVLAMSNSIKWKLSSDEASNIDEAERILHVSGLCPVTKHQMKCFGQSFVDPTSGVINYIFEVEEQLPDGSIVFTRIPEAGYNRIRRINRDEVVKWCQNAGLSVFAEYGTFSLEPFDPKKHHIYIVLARKP